MTGGEIAAAAAGQAVAKAAKAALSEDDGTKKEIVAAARDTPGFSRAAELRGRRLAAREQAVLNLFRPLYRLVGVSREYFEGDFAGDLAAKLAGVPEERRTVPSAPLAAQAMQGLGWSLDEPELKEMYLNLLAGATDSARSRSAHPSFAEIIKQLSPQEASLLNVLLPTIDRGMPMVGARLLVSKSRQPGQFIQLARHILDLKSITGAPAVQPMLATWVDNWVRLGLVEADYASYRANEGAYDWAEQRPELSRLRSTHDTDDSEVELQKGLIRSTDFGKQFMRAVTSPSGAVVRSDPSNDGK